MFSVLSFILLKKRDSTPTYFFLEREVVLDLCYKLGEKKKESKMEVLEVQSLHFSFFKIMIDAFIVTVFMTVSFLVQKKSCQFYVIKRQAIQSPMSLKIHITY